MKEKISDFTRLLKQRIQNYGQELFEDNSGFVIYTNNGIAVIYGLASVFLYEAILLENGVKGMVFSIQEDYLTILLFPSYNTKQETEPGMKASRTQRVFSIRENEWIPFANKDIPNTYKAQSINSIINKAENRELPLIPQNQASPFPKINSRLLTGYLNIDYLFPLREGGSNLIRTNQSKTILAMINQLLQLYPDYIFVYLMFGKSEKEISDILAYSEQFNNLLLFFDHSRNNLTTPYLLSQFGQSLSYWIHQNEKNSILIIDDVSAFGKKMMEMFKNLEQPIKENFINHVIRTVISTFCNSSTIEQGNKTFSFTSLLFESTQQEEVFIGFDEWINPYMDTIIQWNPSIQEEENFADIHMPSSFSAYDFKKDRARSHLLWKTIYDYLDIKAYIHHRAEYNSEIDESYNKGVKLQTLLENRIDQLDPERLVLLEKALLWWLEKEDWFKLSKTEVQGVLEKLVEQIKNINPTEFSSQDIIEEKMF